MFKTTTKQKYFIVENIWGSVLDNDWVLFESLMQVSEARCCLAAVWVWREEDDWSFDLLSVIKIDIVQGCIIIMVLTSASKCSIRRFVSTEKAPTRAFSWLKAPTSAFTFKTLLRHYAKQALTPPSLNVKLGLRRNYHKGRVAIRHYANQPVRPLWLVS